MLPGYAGTILRIDLAHNKIDKQPLPAEMAEASGVAIEIDLAVGVLEECPVCRRIFDRQHDDRLPAAEPGRWPARGGHLRSVATLRTGRGLVLGTGRSDRLPTKTR